MRTIGTGKPGLSIGIGDAGRGDHKFCYDEKINTIREHIPNTMRMTYCKQNCTVHWCGCLSMRKEKYNRGD